MIPFRSAFRAQLAVALTFALSARASHTACPPPPTNVACASVETWEEFRAATLTSTGDLVLCEGTTLVKTADDQHATIKRSLRIACEVPRTCTIKGPGRHINIKTIGSEIDTTIQGIRFEGADFTSVSIFSMSTGVHTLCDNEFVDNHRPTYSEKGGGAVKAEPQTNLIIASCRFSGNSARTGGAVSTSGVYANIVDSVFDNNSAERGGAVESLSYIEIGSTFFSGNSASGGSSSTVSLVDGGIGNWKDLGTNSAYDNGCNGFLDDAIGFERCYEFIKEPNRSPFELGELYTDGETNLQVAQGLIIEKLARAGDPVYYVNGQNSGSCRFHEQPDGAATFYDSRVNYDGGFHYCSNSEKRRSGGVYCLVLDRDCRVTDYVKRLGGEWNDGCGDPPRGIQTEWNCNGGKTPWNTWVSCEEVYMDDGGGYCWQVDPYGIRQPQEILGIGKGVWEAMAVDNRDPYKPVFYFTEDASKGAVRQFTPPQSQELPGWDHLHRYGGDLRFLVFNEDRTFYWSTDLDKGRESADDYFPYVEGIAFMEVNGVGTLFFVAKSDEILFTLNLETQTWSARSSNAYLINGGSFTAEPDAITSVGENFLWHSEDGGSTPGAYLMDVRTNEYYTIFQDNDPDDGEETTGIAISPDGRCMIGCLQEKGECYSFKRFDGGSLEHLGLRLRVR